MLAILELGMQVCLMVGILFKNRMLETQLNST